MTNSNQSANESEIPVLIATPFDITPNEEIIVEEVSEEELAKFNDEDLDDLEKMIQDVTDNFEVFKGFIEEYSNNQSVTQDTHQKMVETLDKLRSTKVGLSLIEDVNFMKDFSDTINRNSELDLEKK